jgi:hypothetical protein
MFTKERYNSLISIEIEFYSKENESSVRMQLSSTSNRKVLRSDILMEPIMPNFDFLKLEQMASKKYRISSGFIPYSEARLLTYKIFDWIKTNGKTSWDCDFSFSVMFNDFGMMGTPNISRLNILKMILHYPENSVYDLFPERKSFPRSKSIKNIYPSSKFYIDTPSSLSSNSFTFPLRKYYGIDFTSLDSGSLRFRYLGGSDYHEKIEDCFKVIDLSIDCLRHCLKNSDLSDLEKNNLEDILESNQKIIDSYASAEALKKNFPNITLMSDLTTHAQIVDTMYPYIRDKIFKLLSESRMTKGFINYDSNQGKLQIKDTVISNAYLLDDVDIFDSKITGNISNCDIFSSQLSNSDIFTSNLFNKSKAVNSFFDNSYLNNNSTLIDCDIMGMNTIISGIVDGGRLISGKVVTRQAKISDLTEIISFEKIS